MHVLFVSPEVAPFSSSGMLGEFSSSLPGALRELGIHVTVITPFYRGISPERFALARRIRKLEFPVGSQAVEIGLLDGKFVNSDVPILFIDHPQSFDRDGYYEDEGGAYPDNHRRFYLLCRAALCVAEALGLKADLIHANDWQTGLLPLLLRQGVAPSLQNCKTLFTVHDPSFGNDFGPEILDELNIDRELFHQDGIEFHGRVSLTKAGIVCSDRITTLSPSYARELRTETFGAGLHGLFSALGERLSGIQLGIDRTSWNPQSDTRIAARFGPDDLTGKAACKSALQEELGLKIRPQVPLVTLLGSIRWAESLDLLLKAVRQLSPHLLQLGIFGSFPQSQLSDLLSLAEQSDESIAFRPELDLDSTRRIVAGSDAVLLPVRYEPGGVLQLRAMRYGAIPLVRPVGGLKDTVVDVDVKTRTGTGICFFDFTEKALLSALHRLLSLYGDQDAWQAIVQNSMRQVFDLKQSAQRYREVYTSCCCG